MSPFAPCVRTSRTVLDRYRTCKSAALRELLERGPKTLRGDVGRFADRGIRTVGEWQGRRWKDRQPPRQLQYA